MFATSVVVSALIPLDVILPGGHEASSWLSVTVRVPSGSPVHIVDLFGSPSLGLRTLAVVVRKRLVSSNSCVRESLKDDCRYSPPLRHARGFYPKATNYRYFALT